VERKRPTKKKKVQRDLEKNSEDGIMAKKKKGRDSLSVTITRALGKK